MPRKFPFVPKSTASLEPGDFWSIPLPNGRYGCGRVLALQPKVGPGARSMLIVGLMNWSGNAPPRSDDLPGRGLAERGQIHISCIQRTGGEILGSRRLDLDGIGPALFLSEAPGQRCLLMQGYDYTRLATEQEQATLPVWCTWGHLYMQKKAEAIDRGVAQPPR